MSKNKIEMTPLQEVYYLLTLFAMHSFNDMDGKHYDDYSEYESDSAMLQEILVKLRDLCTEEDERINPARVHFLDLEDDFHTAFDEAIKIIRS